MFRDILQRIVRHAKQPQFIQAFKSQTFNKSYPVVVKQRESQMRIPFETASPNILYVIESIIKI